MNIINVGIADDHRLFRKGLIALLSTYDDINIIWEAVDGKDLLEKVEENKPDIILVDINMPKLSGIDATRRLTYLHPGIKIIALSMYEDEGHILAMMNNGARGYLIKDSEPSEIYISIVDLYNRGYLNSSLVSNTLTHKKTEENIDGILFATLTDREKEYLNLIAKGLSSRQMSDITKLSARTIEGHIEKIMVKLEAKNRIQLVKFAIKNGIADV